MNLLSVMLMILFPLSPALRLLEFVRWFMGRVLLGLEDPDYVAELKEGGEELIKLDHWLCDMEYFTHIVIGYLARDRLGLPFRDHRYSNTGIRARARSGKPLTYREVFGRFERIAEMLASIDHLAQRRAVRIARELDANPLGLPNHLALILRSGVAASRRTAALPTRSSSSSIENGAAARYYYAPLIRGPPGFPQV